MTTIPRNHIVFFHDKSVIPERSQTAYSATLKNNPDVNHIYLDDAATLALAEEHFPHLVDTYRSIQIPVTRCDMARLMATYVHGGIYSDIAMGFERDARGLISEGDALVLVRRDDFPIYKDKAAAHLIAGLFASEPRHDFILSWLKRMYFCIATGVHAFNCAEAGGPSPITEEFFLRQLQNTPSVRVWNFSELQGKWFKSLRDPTVNNTWIETQREGILPRSKLPKRLPHELFWDNACDPYK
ncbi:MAG: glycosyltransferase [Pseudomonadota bacterium]